MTRSSSASAWAAISCAVAARSSAASLLRVVTPSTRRIAALTSAMPWAWSADADETCCTISVVWRVESSVSASSDSERVVTTWLRDASSRMLSAASWLRTASSRTSVATTEKPRPCSPARAASMSAFSDSTVVWFAMSSMIAMRSRIARIIVTVSRIAAPLSAMDVAPRSAKRRISWACSGLRVLCAVMRSRCAIVVWIAAVSSRVPPESCCADPDTWTAAALMALALDRRDAVTSVRRSVIAAKARPKLSASERGATRTETFPSPICCATFAMSRR